MGIVDCERQSLQDVDQQLVKEALRWILEACDEGAALMKHFASPREAAASNWDAR